MLISKRLTMFGQAFNLLATLVIILAVGGGAFAQSKDRNNPTKLTSNEITGFIEGTSDGKTAFYYYSFVAGSGEVAITLDVEPIQGGIFANYSIFDEDGNKVLGGGIYTAPSLGDQKEVKRFAASRKTPLILRLELSGSSRVDSGKFRMRLSGAVELNGAAVLTCLPKQGTLRLKLADGSVKEIDLKQLAEATVVPNP